MKIRLSKALTSIAFALLVLLAAWPTIADDTQSSSTLVRAIIDAPSIEMSFARAKLMVDGFSDPSIDEAATLAELDRMVCAVLGEPVSGTHFPENSHFTGNFADLGRITLSVQANRLCESMACRRNSLDNRTGNLGR